MSIYFVIAAGGLLGIFLHSLKAVNSINKKMEGVSFRDVFVEYWKHDKLAVFTAVCCFGVLLFVSSEFVNLNELEAGHNEPLKERLFHFRLATFIKTASVIAGYFSDSLVYGFMGVTEKRIQKQLKEQESGQ
jgi:hypothetical protein